MIDRRARLAIAIFFALALRAVEAQQPVPNGGQRGDPYAPAPQQVRPSQPQYPPPVANQALRYPLPTTGTAAAANQPPMPSAAASAVSPATSMIPLTMPSVVPQPVLFAPGQIVARVGDKTILYCDVAPTVNMIMAAAQARAKSEVERQLLAAQSRVQNETEQQTLAAQARAKIEAEIQSLESQRETLTKNVIQQAVQNKMMFMEFERGMPSELKTDAKKRAEAEGKLKKQIRTAFDSTLSAAREKIADASQDDIDAMMRNEAIIVRLAVLMKERHLESPGELDIVLRQYGSSLEQQLRDYGEYMMGMEAARSALIPGKGDPKGKGAKKQEVTHQEMLDYYQAHLADYYIPAKARFEILTARFAKFAGDRIATKDAVARMGNEVILGGTPFPAVARKHSQEPRASEGGYYDWVNPGSLASKPIDQAVFALEVDKLSQIVEDDVGFHIIHVLERKPAGQISFPEAQPEIRKTIESQRRSAEQQKYFANLRTRTKVSTIFDPPAETGPQPAGATPQ